MPKFREDLLLGDLLNAKKASEVELVQWCSTALTYPCRFPVTEPFALRFSALLLSEGTPEVALAL
jgi:hypothetical protein